jgi:RHS repeat-associated protein
VTVSYTPFDLPRSITQGASSVTFGYDGDEQRIRKTTPDEETLYFGDLYERVTRKSPPSTSHRYYIRSPERVVAVVTRGGDKPGTLFVHVDHVGSVDVLTNEAGGVEERRSYDAFGQRRNPVWGQAPPASFSSKSTKGFTGHEDDEELGLVNMRGRIYDPKVGRFLTTDPIISNLYFGQSLNAYGYVLNNPLNYVDPSGFQEADGQARPQVLIRTFIEERPDGTLRNVAIYGPLEEESEEEPEQDSSEAAQFGATAPPTDVDTTGSSADVPQGSTTAPEELQSMGGVRGASGFAYGVGQTWLPGGVLIPSGAPKDRTFEYWRGAGQISAGIVEIVAGFGLLGGGGAAAAGGIAAAAPSGGASLLITALGGSAVMAGWATIAQGGVGVLVGIATIADSMSLSTGAGSGSGSSGPGAAGGAQATKGQGFHSFSAFKRAMGRAGPGKHWHHIVEQTKGNVAKFGAERLHNTQNVVRLDAAFHRQLSAFYSSIRWRITGSTSMTVRQWLSTQSFEAQTAFGQRAIDNVSKGIWP